MIVTNLDLKRVVSEYDIIFEGGMAMPVTIDPFYEDSITFNEDTIDIILAPKPSRNDPTKLLPAEEITVFLSKVCSIQKRSREVVGPSPEEKASWYKEFESLSSKNTIAH